MSKPGKWASRSVPKKGWRCLRIKRGEDRSFVCEMCETQHIRYIHFMTHENYPDGLRVGCVCAGGMEGDVEAARQREADFKKNAARRSRWLSLNWRTSASGNAFINTSDGFNVVAFRRGVAWAARVLHRASGRQRVSKRPYKSADAAKLAAFDAMLRMKQNASERTDTEA